MDVTCERCSTEYEFDETLLSAKGTSVKCTNCGHIFKVYPRVEGDGDRSTSTWRLRRSDGSTDAIDSLRELQRRISSGELKPEDCISRGDEDWKDLGAIPELETFFRAAGAQVPQPSPSPSPIPDAPAPSQRRPRQPTLLGVVPVPKPPSNTAAAIEPTPRPPAAEEDRDEVPLRAVEPSPEPTNEDSLRLPDEDPVDEGRAEAEAPVQESLGLEDPSSAPRSSSDDAIEDADFEEAAAPRGRSTPPPAYFDDDDDDIPELPGRGWSPTRWLFLVALVGSAAVVALQWEQFLDLIGLDEPAAGAAADIENGDAALARDHLEAYQRAIDAYQRVAEARDGEDASLLTKLARAHALAAQAIADAEGSDATEDSRIEAYADDARSYAERALMVDPQSFEARVAEADALRLQGELARSREALERARLMPFSRRPEFFRVDALLVAAEHDGTRARGMLSAQQAAEGAPDGIRYRLLLARAELAADDTARARSEVEAVLAMAPAHPAATALLDEIERAEAGSDDESSGVEETPEPESIAEEAEDEETEPPAKDEAETAAEDAETEEAASPEPEPKPEAEDPDESPRAKPTREQAPTRPARRRTAYDEYDRLAEAAGSEDFVDGRPPVRDFGWYMREGEASLAGRDFTKARALFESALEARPGSGNATDALGRVAFASGDFELAVRYFRSAAQRGHPDGYYNLGRAYERLGKREEAVSGYYTYLKRRPEGTHVQAARAAIKTLEPRVKLPEPEDPPSDPPPPPPKESEVP